MKKTRRSFVFKIGVGTTGLVAGCLELRQPATESMPRDTTTNLPEECAESVHISELSSSSQEEFRTALEADGLTRDNEDDFRIRDELPNVDDEIGGGTETCVLFQGEHYYPEFGPVGGPDEDWELEFKVAGNDSTNGVDTVRTDEGTTGADGP